MEYLLGLGGTLVLVLVGLFVGKAVENKHLQNLALREGQLRHILYCNLKRLPTNVKVENCFLVNGCVVIATDYFKAFVAHWRNIFGGEMRSYRSLMDRARREAMVRMLEQAQQAGAQLVWNVRFDTIPLKDSEGKASGVEMLAYGTAVVIRPA